MGKWRKSRGELRKSRRCRKSEWREWRRRKKLENKYDS